MKKILSALLSISIGAVFIASAAAKIYPMEPFEFQFVDMGIATWNTAPYIARVFIGMEFFLGMLLIFNISIRKFTVKFAMALLMVFTVYLAYKIYTEGNTGNCGCFGETLKMTPLQGILKNIVLLIACAVLYFLADWEWRIERWKYPVMCVMLVISLCLGFFIYPVNAVFNSAMDKKKVNYKLPLELMYTSKQMQKPKIDLRKGKHVIAFLSLTCGHCRIAAKKIHVMNKKNPSIPFYLSLNGDEELLPVFFDDTHVQNIPHNLFLGPTEWLPVAGISLPIIMCVDDGIVKKKFDGMDLNESYIEDWLKK
jgi:hypothetical protein